MKQFLFYFILFVFFSCNKENLALNVEDTNMNLGDLKVGQKFYYVLSKGKGYDRLLNSTYEYTGDTLEVKVIKKIGNRHLLSESITEESPMKLSTNVYLWGNDFENIWEIRNDSLFIEPHKDSYFDSYLMSRKGLPLQKFTEAEIPSDGLGFLYAHSSNAKLYVKNYAFLGKSYDQLNVQVNNWGTSVDAAGITTVYSKEHGIVKKITYSPSLGTGYSWNRVRIEYQ